MVAKKPKPIRQAPTGQMIDIGQVILAGGMTIATDTKHQGRIETRQRAVEEFIAHGVDLLPPPMGAIIASCALAGIRPGQGRGRGFLHGADKVARETAMKEAREVCKQLLDKAKASGKYRNPPAWAREEAAKWARERMLELGVRTPPSVATIKKRKLLP